MSEQHSITPKRIQAFVGPLVDYDGWYSFRWYGTSFRLEGEPCDLPPDIEYVRADLYAGLERENERLTIKLILAANEIVALEDRCAALEGEP